MHEGIVEKFKPRIEQIVGETCEFTIRNNGPDGSVRGNITKRGARYPMTVAFFELASIPGMPGVAVSSNFYITESERGKGLGTLLNGLKLELAREMGYHALIATVNNQNVAEKRLLATNDWTPVFLFRNERDHFVEVFMKDLN